MTTVRGAFSLREAAYLESLPAVKHVTASRITYDESFKVECMRRYLKGESARKIFREFGLDPKIIGDKRIERCVSRWKRTGTIVEAAVEQDERRKLEAVAASCKGKAPEHVDGTNMEILMNSYSIADAAFAALSSGKNGHGMPDMRDLIICQQAQQINFLEKQVEALRNEHAPMREDDGMETVHDGFSRDGNASDSSVT